MSKIQDALRKFQSDNSGSVKMPAIRVGPKLEISVTGGVMGSANEIVEVDMQTLRDAGLVVSVEDQKVLTNQYRDIKRPLIASALGRRVTKVEDGNLIVVTSAIAGEGKTFTSVNIALSIAREQDLSVLLVDADVAKPHISNVFGLGESLGLLDFLDGTATAMENVIYRTSVEGVSVLPAGIPRLEAAELLSGSKMESLVRFLADQDPQRLVIFDSPPLLQSSESKVILGIAGQVVLVIKAESTSQGIVAAALEELDDQKAINLVLNQTRDDDKSRYTYGYGYGHELELEEVDRANALQEPLSKS